MLANEIKFDSESQKDIYDILALNGATTRDEICHLFDFDKYIYRHSRYISEIGRSRHTPYFTERETYNRRTTVFDNLDKLLERGLIEKFTKNNGTRGRPPVYWKIKDGESNE